MTTEQPDTPLPPTNSRDDTIFPPLDKVIFVLLGVSLCTAFLTILPGFVMSIVLLRRERNAKAWTVFGTSAVLLPLSLLAWCDLLTENTPFMPDAVVRHRVNARMESNTLTPFPDSAHSIRFYYSGFIAEHFYVRCEIPRDAFDQWAKEMGVGIKEIGDGPNMSRIVTDENWPQILREGLDEEQRIHLRTANHLSWWTPQNIKRGQYVWLGGRPPPSGGLVAYYDYDTGILYFYWHWS